MRPSGTASACTTGKELQGPPQKRTYKKIGPGVAHIYVDLAPDTGVYLAGPFNKTGCLGGLGGSVFDLRAVNGRTVSYQKKQQTGLHDHQHQATVEAPKSEGIYSDQEVFRAMRNSIQPQIDLFRRYMFGLATGPVVCPATGEYLTPQTCDVDHILPNTFQSLSLGFLASLEPKLQLIAYQLHSPDKAIPSLQPLIAQKWEDYHEEHAQLRLLSKKGHR
eukprot:gene5486-5553_t